MSPGGKWFLSLKSLGCPVLRDNEYRGTLCSIDMALVYNIRIEQNYSDCPIQMTLNSSRPVFCWASLSYLIALLPKPLVFLLSLALGPPPAAFSGVLGVLCFFLWLIGCTCHPHLRMPCNQHLPEHRIPFCRKE